MLTRTGAWATVFVSEKAKNLYCRIFAMQISGILLDAFSEASAGFKTQVRMKLGGEPSLSLPHHGRFGMALGPPSDLRALRISRGSVRPFAGGVRPGR